MRRAILLFRDTARAENIFMTLFICFTAAAAAAATSTVTVGTRTVGTFSLQYSTERLPEKLLAILVPFDGVEGAIAHFIAAEQFGLLCNIDNARDGEAG